MNTDPIILYTLISILLLLLIGLGFIWFINRAQSKVTQSKLIEQQLRTNHQKELLISTVKTKEIERRRIARELHDDVSSQLGIINLSLYNLKKKVGNNMELLEILDQIEISLKSSAERTRRISHELMPLMLSKFGIHYVFEDLIRKINITGQILMTIDNSHLLNITNEFKLLNIYRIIQELSNNTIKHANAKSININFVEEQEMIKMIYKDDGQGFDTALANSGLGVSNIKARLSILEGEIEINSSPSNGHTTITKFPNHD